MRVKREKREKGLQSPPGTAHHPKTVEAADAVAAEAVVAESGTAEIWIGEPRTAPQRRTIIIPIFCPSTSIPWRTLIIIMPIISAPFPYVPVHIIQPKGIRRKLSYGSRFFSVFSFGFICISFSSIIIS
jgi:hypothetical protein